MLLCCLRLYKYGGWKMYTNVESCVFLLLTVVVVVCVFGGFGERVCAADGFIFACTDLHLEKSTGMRLLDHRGPICFVS